jgi:hypothetical protein
MGAEDCNNNGVVLHGNKPFHPLPGSQTQLDVLQVMKCLIAHQPFAVCFLYVASHSDDIKEWSECTIQEQINIKVNKLAKKALIHAHLCSTYFDENFPLEDFTIYTNRKMTGPAKLSLEEYWGRAKAKQFFDAKHIVHALDFDSIWWVWHAFGDGKLYTPRCFAFL